MLTAIKLRKLLRYNRRTGVFTWRVSRTNSVCIGDRAGCINRATGYWSIWIDGKLHRACRLAILYVTGEWPAAIVDHRNRIKHDDRYRNLRVADRRQNAANLTKHRDNKSGFKGVCVHSSGRYRAEICVGGVRKYLGLFATPKKAHAKYLQAAKALSGAYAHG